MRPSKFGRAFAISLCLLYSASSGWAEKPHPSLVNPATAKCETCHAAIIKGKVHPVLDAGCDNCHAFSKKEGKSFVGLSAEGNALCAQCHEEQAKRAALPKPHMPIDDCASCHVPHASEQDRLLSSALPDLCLDCHDKEETKKLHKGQPIHATTCVVCHDPHGNDKPKFLTGKVLHPPFAEYSCESCHRATRTKDARLISKVPELCYACHSDLEAKFKGASVHGPVARGECTKCHSPHMAGQAKLVRDRSPKLCYGCHPSIEKAVKANAHAPAKDDCGTCHGTHATGKPHLLLDEMMGGPGIASLCANCHEEAKLKAKHLGADMEKLNCTGCHDPHGSTQKHLLNAASVHPPFAEGCENCHSEGTALSEKDPDLCFMCHDGIKEAVAKAKVPHPALDMGCTSCHTPHASGQAHLIKGPQVKVCGECHAMDYPIYHGIIEIAGCQVCHEPHGGANPKLLKKSGNDLCLDCHDRQARSNLLRDSAGGGKIPNILLSNDKLTGHPVSKHPVLGKPDGKKSVTLPTGMDQVTCLSCHSPHGGKTARLFAFEKETQYDLCSVCHKK